MQNRKIGMVELRMVYRKNGVHPGVSRAERENVGSMDGKRGWKDRPFCQPRGGGRAARSKEAGTIRGGPSSRFRGASVSPLDRDVTRARRFICHCRSSFHATCHKFVRLVPRFPAPPRAYTWQHFCTTSNERTNLFPRHGSKRYREYFCEKCG